MKITDVEVYVVDPTRGASTYNQEPQAVWTFVRVLTDAGVHGWGESSNFPSNGSLIVADAIRHLRPWIVPITPHNAMGPLQVVAGAHAMLAVPNFYRLEHNVANVPWYDRCLDRPLDLRGDQLHVSPRPGLGVDLDPDFLRAHRAAGSAE